jgi:hypothetical protein
MKGVLGEYQVKRYHGVRKLYSDRWPTVGGILHDAA